MAIQAFPKTYTLSDYNETETDLNASQFNTAYEMPVDKGVTESFGRGTAGNQTDAEGRVYADLQNASGNMITGKLRLAVRTKQGRLVSVINEFDLEEINVGADNRTDRYPFPIQRYQTSEGVKRWTAYPFVVTLEVKPDSDESLSTGDSTLKMDGKRGEQTA